MIHHHTRAEVRRFDIFKLVVTLALIALLIWQLLAGRNTVNIAETVTTETADTSPIAVVEEAKVEETAITEPETEAATSTESETEVESEPEPIMVPSFDLPDGDLQPGELTLNGQGTPGSIVELLVDGAVVGSATVGADGSWSLPVMLAAGVASLSAQALDAAGTVAAASESFELNLPAPTMPAIDLPTVDLTPGSFTWTGKADPGALVELLVDGEVAGSATADADGNWSLPVELAAGDYHISARLLDASGNSLLESEPTLFTIAAAAETATLAITSPSGGTNLDSGEVTFSGTGEPGTEIELLDNGAVVGTAVVSDDGVWRILYTPTAGDHEFIVRVIGSDTSSEPIQATMAAEAAESAPAETTTFVCGEGRPGIDQGDTYIVGDCDYLAKIATQTGVGLQELIAVNPQIKDPNLIFPEQVINMPPR